MDLPTEWTDVCVFVCVHVQMNKTQKKNTHNKQIQHHEVLFNVSDEEYL